MSDEDNGAGAASCLVMCALTTIGIMSLLILAYAVAGGLR
jgi:hypothetical protein